MKARELVELTTAEIEQKIVSYKEELFNLRFRSATGYLDNPARLGQVRRNIARCKTVLRERELGIERRKQG
jgi:large subunit ribosomal protein L29